MIEDDLVQFLRSRDEITGTTGQRIRPGALLQGDADAASIRLQTVSSPSEHRLSGPSGAVGKRVQLDIFSKDYRETKALAESVRLAMYSFPGQHGDANIRSVRMDDASDTIEELSDGSDDFRFRTRQDWLVWHFETIPA